MLGPDTNLVIVYGLDQCLDKSQDDLKALANLTLQLGKIGQPGNGLILIRDYANAQGLLDMGVDSRYLPGYVTAGQKGIERFNKLWNVRPEENFQTRGSSKKMLREQKNQSPVDFRGKSADLRAAAQKLFQGCGIYFAARPFQNRHGRSSRRGSSRFDAPGK